MSAHRPITAGTAAQIEDGVQWRRMHPVTPAVKGWKVFVAALVVIGTQSADGVQELADWLGGRVWLAAAALLVVVLLVGFGYSAIAWRVTRFAVTDDAVQLRTGVLFRQQRHARLDRLQAIDVVQPLLARLFGLAELRLEVAGGAGSAVSLAFLREAEAEQLRADLLARAAGLHRRPSDAAPAPGPAVGTDAGATAGPHPAAPVASGGMTVPGAQSAIEGEVPGAPDFLPPAQTAPERPVFSVPLPRLLLSTLLTWAVLWLLVWVGVVVVVMIVSRSIGPVVGILPAMFAVVSYLWGRLNRGANFRAAISPDGIRLRHGLTETRAQTVPPGRVQAVRIYQSILWRKADWWRMEINVAGYSQEDDSQQTDTSLLPVGTREDVMLALWLVLPDLGVEDPHALVDAGLTRTDREFGFLTAPRRSRWLDPIAWRRTGVTVTERALLMRRGRITRCLVVVPHERTQSLGLSQGPLERRMGLASFQVHSTPGPVTPAVHHLAATDAAQLIEDQSVRARTARAGAGPEQWMSGR
ncbi:PH domain-containing protein [Cellulomonas sp. NPDC089187]|uniref:PH domain-containing protein n=1 Tax=Cellulomonas sp. NPDC089187 TaxID=3154970 RepID=UPI00341EEDA6